MTGTLSLLITDFKMKRRRRKKKGSEGAIIVTMCIHFLTYHENEV